ncbi:MAG: MoaD/ThiS family protein [Nanoarchaeota archaeon]|nr:MoaD/ThiS family protein [Nanoarchaeota archaeon]
MKVYLERTGKEVELRATDGRDLLKQLKIPEAEAILVRNNEVVLPDEALRETDDIHILSVVSGG